MKKKLRALALFTIVIAILFFMWEKMPRADNPKNRIMWSLAVVRTLKGSEFGVSTNIYMATNDAVYVPSGIMLWQRKQVGTGDSPIVALAADARGDIAAGNMDGQLFLSHDGGNTWVSFGLSKYPISSILIRENDDSITAATFGDGIFTIHNGTADRVADNGLDANVWCLLRRSDWSLTALTAAGTYEARSSGDAWTHVSGPSNLGLCSRDEDGTIFAVADGDLLVSDDDGLTTNRIRFGNDSTLNVWSIATDDAGDVVVGTSKGPYFSQDHGKSFNPLTYSANNVNQFATSFQLETPVFAQESPDPIGAVHTIGPGPTLLPPINTPISPTPGITIRIDPSTRAPVGSGKLDVPEPRQITPNGDRGRNDDEEPPPPPGRTQTATTVIPCRQDAEADEGCDAGPTARYFNDLMDTQSLTSMVDYFVEKPPMLTVLADQAAMKILQSGLQKVVGRLASRAFETIHAAAQASSPTIAQAARDQETYIEDTDANAVSESIQRVTTPSAPSPQGSSDSQTPSSSTDSNDSDSERHPGLGSEMHKAAFFSVHSGAQWN